MTSVLRTSPRTHPDKAFFGEVISGAEEFPDAMPSCRENLPRGCILRRPFASDI